MTWWYGFPPEEGASEDVPKREDVIADRLIRYGSYIDRATTSPGRRMRVFSLTISAGATYKTANPRNFHHSFSIPFDEEPTYRQVLAYIEADDELRGFYADIPLRSGIFAFGAQLHESIPEDYVWERSARDPELHPALQDLAYAIGSDLTEACNGFTDPDYYYPGVDEGIEPVTDDHVRLVIWGALRELKRELRQQKGGGLVRPHAPIDELPWRFQRAFAERRRMRYQQYGIGRAEWETNQWGLWAIPEDADWVPPWVTK